VNEVKEMKKEKMSRGFALLFSFVALFAITACGPSPGDDDDDTGTEEGPTCTWEKVYDDEVNWIEGFSADEIYAMNGNGDVIRWDGTSWTLLFKQKEGIDMTVPFVDNERSFYFQRPAKRHGIGLLRRDSAIPWGCRTSNCHKRSG
jgi:hypothetical protein